MSLTHKRLLRLFSYDPETGMFTRLVDIVSPRMNGNLVVGKRGFVIGGRHGIHIDGQKHKVHRLAWFYMTGVYPPNGVEIDHINRDPADNRWTNLRLATRTQNVRNCGVRRHNKLGIKGVRYRAGKYEPRIRVDGTVIGLGRHDTKEDASRAYCLAALKYHGEFASFGMTGEEWNQLWQPLLA